MARPDWRAWLAGGGEQTQPEYDESKDQPVVVPEPSPAPRGEQSYVPPPPTDTLGEQTQPFWSPWMQAFAPSFDFLNDPLRIPTTNRFGIGTDPYHGGFEIAAENGLWYRDFVTPEGTQGHGEEPIAAESEIVRQLLGPFADGAYRVTGRYGQKGGPYPETGHIGLDIVPTGDDFGIYAPLRGEVIENGFTNGYGNYLKIRHPDGTVTLYAHMAGRSPLAVGSEVSDRQLIGQMGHSGHATGNHLHFEVYDAEGNRYDPLLWLGGEAPGDYSAAPQPSDTAPQPIGPAPTEPPDGEKWTSQDAIDAIWYWGKRYGYSESFIHFALAVAFGESGMDPYNDRGDNGLSKGIFQFLTRGGRGEGYSDEQLFNPYFESEINLPYLYAAYTKYGGDSAWASDPYSVLKNGWKYGQGSIWPTDAQLRAALAYTGKAPSSSRPEPPVDTEPLARSKLMEQFSPQRVNPFLGWLLAERFGYPAPVAPGEENDELPPTFAPPAANRELPWYLALDRTRGGGAMMGGR